jgi:hypothetical protein
MTRSSDREPLDPELASLLESAEADGPPPDLGELYAGLQGRIRAAEASPLARLRAQPTWRRRTLGIGAIVLVVTLSTVLRPRPDLDAYPLPYLLLHVASLGALLAVCAFAALRPLHRPALSRVTSVGLGALAIGASVLLAVAPGLHEHAVELDGIPLWRHATPCLAHGLAVGLPLYAALRALDRGNILGRVLAASAAGLAGNLALALHCAIGGAPHLLSGHVGVVASFVVGTLLVELALQRKHA